MGSCILVPTSLIFVGAAVASIPEVQTIGCIGIASTPINILSYISVKRLHDDHQLLCDIQPSLTRLLHERAEQTKKSKRES